ncbi:hypothetical protein [Paenarthrobacter nitroguajacolicus]|uniref:hypothetical protein n=1 Tax=Paenarthrobacter nitroguajacolicus TaxID=211146 RepID=UPI00248CDA84|nr:hypothetical protein [Paenarthrobacter nitroguajacolicus]MDI2032984.1 hypothetical protein [Paenarthrobacter nitroguajacolicus]
MATQYGFKLWEVTVHDGFSRSPLDLTEAQLDSKDTATKLFPSLRAIAKSTAGLTRTEVLRYRTYSPEEDAAGDKEDTTPSIRLLSHSVSGSNLTFEYRFGRRGSHDIAIAPDAGQDASLADKASSNRFRAYLFLPTSGTKAVFASEARNSMCPGTDLLKLLGVTSKEQDEARETKDQIGWWRFLPKQVTDEEQLKSFIRSGHANAVRLEKITSSGSGARERKAITVRQSGLSGSKLDQAKILGAEWFGVKAKDLGLDGKPPKGKDDLAKLAALVDLQLKPGQFDDGGLEWEGPDGSTQFVKPDGARDVFTYRVGKRGSAPTDKELERAIKNRVKLLATSRKWHLTI